MTRDTGGGILLTESTRGGLGDGVELAPSRALNVGDSGQAIPVYRLVGLPAQ